MAAAFGESHSAQSTCCCWLAEHRQRVHQRLAGRHNNRSLVAHEIGRPGIIFRGTGKRISQVDKAAWHPASTSNRRAVPEWTAADYFNRWVDKTFKAVVTGGSGVKPAEQSVVFADNPHGQTTEEFKK